MIRKRTAMQRARKLEKRDTREHRPCGFCAANPSENHIVEETPHMFVLHNRTSYDLFEGIPVREHLMLIPKSHHISMDTLTAEERREYIDLLCKYEAAGYSMYGRALPNKERSMEHIHMHLMKLEGGRVKNLLFLEKPYLVLHGKQRKASSKF